MVGRAQQNYISFLVVYLFIWLLIVTTELVFCFSFSGVYDYFFCVVVSIILSILSGIRNPVCISKFFWKHEKNIRFFFYRNELHRKKCTPYNYSQCSRVIVATEDINVVDKKSQWSFWSSIKSDYEQNKEIVNYKVCYGVSCRRDHHNHYHHHHHRHCQRSCIIDPQYWQKKK